MPVLLVLLLLSVNILPSVAAETAPTQIRGPKSSDSVLLQKQVGPLTANDTLWRIAEQIKPSSSVTTYQVMYALYVKNPSAFIDGNVNHLRPGAVLIVPELREMRLVDAEMARRKAEMDDKLWAEHIAREAATRARAREQANRPNQAQQQAAAELNVLKEQYADSMQLIEGIARENAQLKGALGKVEQELEGLKSQLAEDSLLQQQLNQLLQQQQQILAEQQAQREAEEAARAAALQQPSLLQTLIASPLSWMLAASAPAILLLLGALFWIKRRSRKTEEVVAAAIKEPDNRGYTSPVPPLDTGQDFDDSLFNLDDSLLNETFSAPADNVKGQPNSNNAVLDDELPDFSDDILLDELTEQDPLRTDMLDGDPDSLLDNNLDDVLAGIKPHAESNVSATSQSPGELALAASDELSFDADNILSDTDLSALLSMEDDSDDEIEVIELAESEESVEQGAHDSNVPDTSQFSGQDDIDSLLEEIELELPTLAEDSPSAAWDVEHDELDTLLLDSETDQASAIRPDNSELEEFAEQLATEEVVSAEALDAEIPETSTEEAGLAAELTGILQHAAALGGRETTDDGAHSAELAKRHEVIDEDAELAAHLAPESAASLLTEVLHDEPDAFELDLNADDDSSVSRISEAALSVENPSKVLDSYPELAMPDELPADVMLSDESFRASDHMATDRSSALNNMPEKRLSPDSDEADDDAVGASEQDEAVLSAEQIAQLTTDIDDGITQAEPVTVELESDFAVNSSETLAAGDANRNDSDALAAIDDLQFDALLDELEGIEPQDSMDIESHDSLDIDPEEVELPLLSDEDFVEIDNLLQAMEHAEEDQGRFEQLNVDVGLDEFADIIGEHNKMDVDKEDAGFAGKLDLIRAYIEMDESDTATQMIEELLASAAPQHVKEEAKALKPE